MPNVQISTIFLYDENNKILMQHRSETDDKYPGYWTCFGGHVEKGETPEQALRRELFEELEYRVEKPILLLSRKNASLYDGQIVETFTYIEKYDNSQKLVLHEGQGYGWFTIEEALDLKISELRKQDILSLKKYFDQQHNTKP